MNTDEHGNVISPRYWDVKNKAYYEFKFSIKSLETSLSHLHLKIDKLLGLPQSVDFVSIDEAAKILGCTKRNIFKQMANGNLMSFRPTQRKVYLSRADVTNYKYKR